MRVIELDPFEEKDLINYLERLKELLPERDPYLTNGNDKWITKRYHVMRIDHLIDVIRGKTISAGYFKQSRNARELEETLKKANENKKAEDLDLLEYLEELL
mgnify:CR=1 FL=1